MFGLPRLDIARLQDAASQLVRFLQAVEMIVTWRHKTSKIWGAKLEVRWCCLL